jgi:hypothetical protein
MRSMRLKVSFHPSGEPVELVDDHSVDGAGPYPVHQGLHPFAVQILAALACVHQDLRELQIIQAAVCLDLGPLVLEADTFPGLLIRAHPDVADGLHAPDSFDYLYITLLRVIYNLSSDSSQIVSYYTTTRNMVI